MIVVTSDGEIPSKMGNSFTTTKMAQGFYELGKNVEIVTLLSLPLIKRITRIKNIYRYYGIVDTIKIKRVPVFNKDFFSKTIFAKGYNERAVKYILKKKPEFIYCRSFLTPYLAVKKNIPTIVETHTTLYNQPDLQKVYEIAHVESFLGLVTIHKNIKKEHIKRGIPENKILVLEDGVDLKNFAIDDDKNIWRKKLGLNVDARIVMYCGSLYKLKGIEDILLCAKSLQKYCNISFVIVGGENRHRGMWERYVHKNDIRNVTFVGFVDNRDVPKYLKAADILIMPYDVKEKHMEIDINSTSPLKLFEYMASKRPIISSNIPVISKVVTHNENAMLAEANNIDMLADYIIELLEDVEKRQYLARNAYEIVKKYEWKKRCEMIIKNLVDNSSRT